MALPAGATLGPYKIVALLGAGGMGEVYRAKDPRIGREVAIKVLSSSVVADSDRLRRFEHEARATGTLNHPNILAIYDVGTQNGSPYLVSELLEGETLRMRLGSPLPVRKAIEYAIQVTHGLAAAHEKGIIHRDLKPENIFITKDGLAKILDFGLAKLVRREAPDENVSELSTKTGVVMGTVGYMSPEQVSAQSVDHRSDIFSFGAILYEMLSGKKAFRGKGPVEKMHAILNDDPPPILGIPAGLDRIVRDCLEKKPEERFQSARDLGLALEAVSGPSDTRTEVSLAPKRSYLLPVIITTVLLIGAVTGFLAGIRAQLAKTTSGSQPSYHRLTFRRGTIHSARFAPDGHTVLYSAAWDGNPMEIYTGVPESPEYRSLGLSNAELLSISRTGELAVLVRCKYEDVNWGFNGTLARVPSSGGIPRELAEDVLSADWSPDGQNLAVVRHRYGDDTFRLEFPVGKVLYETSNELRDVRVAPKGDLIAFTEDESIINVIDRAGKKQTLSGGWGYAWGIAWSPSGDEVWATVSRATSFPKELHAVDLSGKERLVLPLTAELVLQDISRDHRVLMTVNSDRAAISALPPDETTERDLSWFDFSFARDISKDGKTVLLNEVGEGTGGAEYTTYVRNTDGSPAIQLGKGLPCEFSPDGKLVLARGSVGKKLFLIPTGAGEVRELAAGPIQEYWIDVGSWLPDGKRILFQGKEKGHEFRVYVQDITSATPHAISPEGTGIVRHPVSPDGRLVVLWGPDGRFWLYPLDHGEARPIPGLERKDSTVFGWSGDGRALYVTEVTKHQVPLAVYLHDPSTGRREFWKNLVPSDPTGIVWFFNAHITPDGKAYAYSYVRVLSELYSVEGLK